MKIKKIEIQAFRAYDAVKDGTFDFKLHEREDYADFISLYAPNGFGKTSFYDAVEFGYTNNIDRLLKNKNNKDIAKSEKNIGNNERQYILRNRYSNANLDSFVKLQTNKNEIKRDIPMPRKGSSDFKFDDKETENKYFREVILSQDWISGFLKEDKPEDRYKIFIEYFGDKEIDKYYNTLVSLLHQNGKEIKKLNEKLKEIQLVLKFDGDKDVLSKVNEKITLINQNTKLFHTVNTQTSETDILDLKNSISQRLSDIEFEIVRHQKLIIDLDRLIIGNETIVGFRKFRENNVTLSKLLERRKGLEETLKLFEELKKERAELSSIQEHNIKLTKEKEDKEKISELFNIYQEIQRKIQDKQNDIEVLQSSNQILKNEISDDKIQLSELEIQISNSQNEARSINGTIDNSSEIDEKIQKSENRIVQLNIGIDSNKKELEKRFDNIASLELLIKELSDALLNIDKNIFPSELERTFSKYLDDLQARDTLAKRYSKETEKLLKLQKDILDHQSFKSELDSFIAKGLSMINEQKTDSCPLCAQKYASFTELADKVANNNLLSETSNILLNKKNEIENVLHTISEKISTLTKKLKDAIEQEIEEQQLIIQQLKGELIVLQQSLSDLEAKTLEELKILSDLRNLMLNKPLEDYRNWATEELGKLSEQIQGLETKITTLRDKIKSSESQYQLSINKENSSIKDLEVLNSDNVLNGVKTFFIANYPNSEIDLKYINDDLSKLNEIHKRHQEDFEKLKISIESKSEEVAGFSEDYVKNEQKELKANEDALSQSIESYLLEVRKHIVIDIDGLEEELFRANIDDLKKSNEFKISQFQNEMKELHLLSQLQENVLPYLKFEENKGRQSDLKANKLLKDKINKKLTEEIDKVSKHIEKQIKSFFYEDLINDLYKRIDPHPDYKKVKFIPDFRDNKPKLNVCVYKDKSDKFIIPNLYFSQAQLNILSLCIFLAKALNAKDDKGEAIDCIFVDDPIQSMDSINILSTIDLLRSIVVNQQKQVILSTHDENFHNLLKKKIPSDLFKSKFMELETFGKVKASRI